MSNDEACQRCGRVGTDRRTLWHACFYAMEELPVPFEEVALQGHMLRKVGQKELTAWSMPGHPMMAPVWEDVPDTEGARWPFYRLRVCKSCRSDWLTAIAAWFTQKPRREEWDDD